jgi:hypothetical protein
MTNSTSSKHLVSFEMPGTGKRIGVAYSTLKEAELQVISLTRDGYKILGIEPMELPKPNGI